MAHFMDMLEDEDSDMELISLPMQHIILEDKPDLSKEVVDLRAEVNRLSDCLRDSLDMQRTMLRQWDRLSKENPTPPAVQPSNIFPMATSTPHVPAMNRGEPTLLTNPSLSPNTLELSNTSRVIAAALHHAKLEPPVFAADNKVQPEDWLQAVTAYRSSLGLTDGQLLNELPHFLAKEPSKWFKALSSHITSWAQFCQLFQTVFLPSDNQERILRGLLDRIQAQDEPLPTFVAHMLSEYNKLKSPPPEREQIELIRKHSLEKYRVALYGAHVTSVMDLLLRAHELHSVLGPSGPQTSRYKEHYKSEPHCFKCSLPGFTTRTCPNCNNSSPTNETAAASAGPSAQSFQPPGPPYLGQPNCENSSTPAPPQDRQPGNYRGGRKFHRGHPPSRH
ncbi:unnamed protein product [Knipowitschia caucasica]